MPLYEYACKACGHHLEVSQSFKDEPLSECPVCGGPLRKVFHSIGVVLKGSGFYRTDSRLPAKKSESSTSSEKSPERSGSGGDGAAAKTETAKSDSKTSSSEAKPSGSGSSSGSSSTKTA